MKIEKVKLSDLNSPDWNPRYITDEDFKKLKNSLETFGYVDPIIVNKHNMNIVGGNQRYQALKKLGWEEVDVVFIDEPDLNREKALNVALNKISGDWDTEKLNILMEELKLNDYDISFTGFEEDEITELIGNESVDSVIELSDEYAEIHYEPKETHHEIKDLYKMTTQYDDMIERIENEELKKLLTIRKYQFCEFNFKKIADYYAYQATPEEQEAIETLALVILDRNNLIKYGFTNILDNYKIDGDLIGE